MRRHNNPRRRDRIGRKTDAFGRDISKPSWYKRLPTGQQCECDVDEFDCRKTRQKHGHSDSLVRYLSLACPECGEEFAWSEYVVEG